METGLVTRNPLDGSSKLVTRLCSSGWRVYLVYRFASSVQVASTTVVVASAACGPHCQRTEHSKSKYKPLPAVPHLYRTGVESLDKGNGPGRRRQRKETKKVTAVGTLSRHYCFRTFFSLLTRTPAGARQAPSAQKESQAHAWEAQTRGRGHFPVAMDIPEGMPPVCGVSMRGGWQGETLKKRSSRGSPAEQMTYKKTSPAPRQRTRF